MTKEEIRKESTTQLFAIAHTLVKEEKITTATGQMIMALIQQIEKTDIDENQLTNQSQK